MILRVLQTQWEPFVRELCERTDVETAGVVLAERLRGGEALLARELLVVPETGYQVRRADQIRIDPVTLNRLVRAARDRGLSVFTVHTHPGSRQPWFSHADDAGDARLMPSLFTQMPGPHGSLVLAGETGIPVGRVWTEPGHPRGLAVHVVGTGLRVHPAASVAGQPGEWWGRQKLALGSDGQAILADLHVAVVGLGGTGSVVLAQLAHLGVGRITVIDGDRVEASNISRIIGAIRQDAGLAWKVDVAARYSKNLGLGANLRVLRGHLGAEVSASDIEECDVVLSCVDAHAPRAILNRLSYERGLPLIDLGSVFRVSREGVVTASAGRVVVAGPGKPCLACWGHLDSERLRLEALSPSERAGLIAEGYIQGADVVQPSVIAFNTAVAGLAVIELLRLVTGFAGADSPPLRLAIDFGTGVVRRNRVLARDGCRICSLHPLTTPAGPVPAVEAEAVDGWMSDLNP